MNSKIFIW